MWFRSYSNMMAGHRKHQTVQAFFRGFVFCGDCHTPMIRRVNQYKGKEKSLLYLPDKNKGGDCTRHSIPEEVLKKLC